MSQLNRLATAFQALSDPVRLRILDLARDSEPCATDINRALSMSQPRVAHHLKILVDSELLVARRDGRFVRYSVAEEGRSALLVQAALRLLAGASDEPPRRMRLSEPRRPEAGPRSDSPERVQPAGSADPDTGFEDSPEDSETAPHIEDFLL